MSLKLNIGMVELPSSEDYLRFLSYLETVSHIAVDTEKDPITDRFLGFAIAYLKLGMYFPIGHLEEGNINEEIYIATAKLLQNHKLRVFQNASHDLQDFEDLGLPLNGRFADVMVLANMIDENIVSKKLDYLHKYFCNGEGKRMHPLMANIIKTMGWQYVPLQLMYDYCMQDAVATSEIFDMIEPMYVEQFGPLFQE
jgi:DNA polymerase I-like protein with 3'-5' exonuclease and polymerase domains